MIRPRRVPPLALSFALSVLSALAVPLGWIASAPAQPPQTPALPAFAQPYPSDDPSPVELYPRVVPGHVARPGDADWPLGPVRAGGFAFEVAADAAMRTPEGAESFRVDYEFPPRASASALSPSGELACLRNGARLDASKTRGIRFAMRASAPTRAVITVNASNGDDPRRVDRFYGSFTVGTEWKIVTIHYRSLAVSAAWRERWDARPGGLPGDGVLRPDRMEEIRIGLDPLQAPPGRGSFWLGDLTFFR